MKRKNRNSRKEIRRYDAIQRKQYRDSLSSDEQLERLAMRGVTSGKEVTRLLKHLEI